MEQKQDKVLIGAYVFGMLLLAAVLLGYMLMTAPTVRAVAILNAAEETCKKLPLPATADPLYVEAMRRSCEYGFTHGHRWSTAESGD